MSIPIRIRLWRRTGPNLYNDDLTPYVGAAGLQPVFASPGTIRGLSGPGVTATTNFAVPAGLSGTTALRFNQIGAAGTQNRQTVWRNVRALPQVTRDTIAGVFKQELTDWLRFKAHANYSRRTGAATWGTNTADRLTLSVPSTNPYSPCNAANFTGATSAGVTCPPSGTINVLWASTNAYQSSLLRAFTSWQYGATGEFEFDLPYEWQGSLSGHTSRAWSRAPHGPTTNTTRMTQVLSGVGKPANVPFFNPFCDDNAAPCNDPLTVAYIRGTSIIIGNTNWLQHYAADFNGPLFDLPGGTVRAAVGADWSTNGLIVNNRTAGNATNTIVQLGVKTTKDQTVKSVFGEIYIPIVGDANAMSFVRKLEVTLAGRITDYQFSGTTKDPKIGVNWTPIDGFKLKASWGTSFRAPTLRENDPVAGASLFVSNAITCGLIVPQPAACGSAATPLSLLRPLGGNPTAGPETATTWSVGAEWTPDYIPGLNVSVNYYNINMKDRINSAANDLGEYGAVNAAGFVFDPLLRLNPTYFPTRAASNQPFPVNGVLVPTATQAEYNAFLLAIYADPKYAGSAITTNPVAYVIDARTANNGLLQTDGIDFQAYYAWDVNEGLSAHAGLGGTYVLKFDESPIAGLPIADHLNLFAYNTQFRARAEAGLKYGAWSGTIFMNYLNGYDIEAALTHPAAPAGAANPFTQIDAYTTFDLSVVYNIGDEVSIPVLRNVILSVNVSNVFDTDPPFVLNAAASNPILYDPMNASPIGRMITLKVAKQW